MLFLFPPLGNLACLALLPVFVKENSFICIVGFPLAVCNDDKAFLNSKLYNLQFHNVFLGNLKVLTIWSPLCCMPGIFVNFEGQACARESVIRWSSLIRHTELVIRWSSDLHCMGIRNLSNLIKQSSDVKKVFFHNDILSNFTCLVIKTSIMRNDKRFCSIVLFFLWCASAATAWVVKVETA